MEAAHRKDQDHFQVFCHVQHGVQLHAPCVYEQDHLVCLHQGQRGHQVWEEISGNLFFNFEKWEIERRILVSWIFFLQGGT